MTAEQEAFERGFLAGFHEGKAINVYYKQTPCPGTIWSDGTLGTPRIGDNTNPNANVLNCDAAYESYNADRLRND